MDRNLGYVGSKVVGNWRGLLAVVLEWVGVCFVWKVVGMVITGGSGWRIW